MRPNRRKILATALHVIPISKRLSLVIKIYQVHLIIENKRGDWGGKNNDFFKLAWKLLGIRVFDELCLPSSWTSCDNTISWISEWIKVLCVSRFKVLSWDIINVVKLGTHFKNFPPLGSHSLEINLTGVLLINYYNYCMLFDVQS